MKPYPLRVRLSDPMNTLKLQAVLPFGVAMRDARAGRLWFDNVLI
jgi:hypothetical protein